MQRPDSFRRQLSYAIIAFLAVVVLAGAGLVGLVRAVTPETLTQRAVVATPSSTPTSTAVPQTSVTASPQMAALVAALPPGSVSVSARNLSTGATLVFGSSGGQTMASVAKVDILETLLLQKQTSGGDLTDDQDTDATAMIEDSDDGAADDLWSDIGGGSATTAANRRLGVRCTVPGPGAEWGLGTTCAQGQIQLLYELESRSSPLDASSRAYILNLMENVNQTQAWGIPVVADPDTGFAVKNGWLNLDGDSDWAVNSDGIVVYHGQTLLIAALTQNNDTVYSGVALVERLARLAAQSVAS